MAINPYERRSFSEIAVATTLTGSINDTDLSCVIASSTGWPSGASGDFYIRVESEDIRVDTRTTTTLTFHANGRGANGTTAAAHTSGTAVTLVFTSYDADEANYAVQQTVGKVAAAGDLLTGSAANALQAITLGTTGLPLVAGASIPAYGQLGTSGIADDAITAAKIGADAVGSAEIAADSITTSELADSAVATANIADLAVTTAKIAALAVTAAELATDAVTTAKILNANVTEDKLATDAVTAAKIAAGAVGSSEIGTDAVGTDELANDAVATANILDLNVTAGKLAADAVTTAKILDANVTLAKIASEAWTSWTPTIGGGWTKGTGTVSGHYIKIGRTYFVKGSFQIGNGTIGSGLTIGGLPAAVVTHTAHGHGCIFDASASTLYPILFSVNTSSTSGTVRGLGVFSAPGASFWSALDANTPLVFAASDIIEFDIMYEAAS